MGEVGGREVGGGWCMRWVMDEVGGGWCVRWVWVVGRWMGVRWVVREVGGG